MDNNALLWSILINIALAIALIAGMERRQRLHYIVNALAPKVSHLPKALVFYIYWYKYARAQNEQYRKLAKEIYIQHVRLKCGSKTYLPDDVEWEAYVDNLIKEEKGYLLLRKKLPSPTGLMWLKNNAKEFEKVYSTVRASL